MPAATSNNVHFLPSPQILDNKSKKGVILITPVFLLIYLEHADVVPEELPKVIIVFGPGMRTSLAIHAANTLQVCRVVFKEYTRKKPCFLPSGTHNLSQASALQKVVDKFNSIVYSQE